MNPNISGTLPRPLKHFQMLRSTICSIVLFTSHALENREHHPMGTLLQMPCQRWLCLLWCVHWVLPSDLYRALPNQSLQCYCKRPLIMTVSHTEKNPERLFLKCSQRPCDFFQWVDREPKGKNKAWFKGSTHPLDPELREKNKEGYATRILCQMSRQAIERLNA